MSASATPDPVGRVAVIPVRAGVLPAGAHDAVRAAERKARMKRRA
mgnify:CR=1 FL=1